MTILPVVGQFIWYTIVSVNDSLARGWIVYWYTLVSVNDYLARGWTVYWYTLVSMNILPAVGQFIIMVHIG